MPISKQLRTLRTLRKDVDKVRNFPHNTCAASRHLHVMADCLLTAKKDGSLRYPMLQDEPEHCAESILSVLYSLWRLRTKVHSQTENCGFDRNASHSENRYVCECGWRETR